MQEANDRYCPRRPQETAAFYHAGRYLDRSAQNVSQKPLSGHSPGNFRRSVTGIGLSSAESHAEDQYCTAEVAIALLDLAGDQPAAKSLGAHFTLFRERYLAGKANHQRSVTAKEAENV
jgi:hypothetical protein